MRPLRDVRSTNYLWLGDIPSTWKLPKTAWHFKIGMGETILGESLVEKGIPVYSATEKDHFFGYVSKANLHLEKGDLVVPARGNSIGHVKIVSQLSTTTQTTIYLKKLSDLLESKFVYWFMKGFKGDLFPFVQTAIPQLTVDEVSKNPIVQPPLYEQRQIATYLNRETAKIDRLIAKQQKLIKLLQEKRQAVISQAVTKGLDPNVKMKDSGVEWLGEVPEHWTLCKLRNIAKIVRGASPRPAGDPKLFASESIEDGLPWVTVAEITKDEDVYLKSTSAYLTPEGVKQSQKFKKGTFLFTNSGATLGVPKILDIDCCANDGVLAFLKVDSNLDPLYLYFYLGTLTSTLREELKQGGGQPNLNTDLVKQIPFVYPSLEIQNQILIYLEERLDKLGNIRLSCEKNMRLLIEHRQALITAAVTGKIDVRGLVTDEEVAALDAEPEVETTEEDFASDVVEDSYITEEE